MDYLQGVMLASYARHLRDLQEPCREDEDDFYRRNDPQNFSPGPGVSIAIVVGLPLLLMAIAGA